MSEKIATIIGSTGMIGTYLQDQLLNDDYFDTVRIIVRRPVEKRNPKMEVKLVDYNVTESLKLALEGTDTLFCAIGTTQKNVKGDRDLYRKVDLEIPLKAAKLGKEIGCEKMVIITAVGANPKSNAFYLKLKGELEEGLQTVGLKAVHIMQPSMLLGDREEKRTAERWFQVITQGISGLFIGSFRKYRAIHGKTVAKAMMNAGKKNEAGFFRYTFDGMNNLAAHNAVEKV